MKHRCIEQMLQRMAIVMLAAVPLTSCLQGERARIVSIYGDPWDSVQGVSPENRGSVPVVAVEEWETSRSFVPGFLSFEVPLAGGRLAYANAPYYMPGYPYRWSDPHRRQWPAVDNPVPQVPWPAAPQTRAVWPSDDRYVYGRGQIRCDNLVQGCYRWSGQKDAYLWDRRATRSYFGRRASRRGAPLLER